MMGGRMESGEARGDVRGAGVITPALPDLTEYPHLASIYDDEFRTRYQRDNETAPDLLWTALCDADPIGDPYRREFNVLISEGVACGLLDNGARSRLRSSSADQRWGAFSELEVGHFFSERAFAWVPRPTGKGRRQGDIGLRLLQPAFVEVKAILDRPIQATQEFISRKVWRIGENCLKKVDRPLWAQTWIQQLAPDFDGGDYRRWLLRGLESNQPLPFHLEYVSRSGLVVQIEVVRSPLTSGEATQTQMPPACWLSTGSYIRQSINKAYEQVPDDGRVSLIILRPHLTFKPGIDDMLDSLYGKQQWIVSVGPKPTLVGTKRARDGFFSRSVRTRVSGVGLLNAVRTEHGTQLSLDLYHNPFARYPLNWQSLAGAAIRHLVPGDDGTMVWVEAPHD